MRWVGFGVVAIAGTLVFGVVSGHASERGSRGLPSTPATVAPAAPAAPAAPTAPAPDASVAPAPATLANAGVKTTTTPSLDAPASCPAGMVEVDGQYCPFVEQKCLRWLDPETHMRCAEFEPTPHCATRTLRRHFCIDEYEYPNQAGAKPQVMVTWTQARDACEAEGKRLCNESEWTLACEGQEHLPYPYGYARNADACNIDRPHPVPNERALVNPRTRDAEIARLDQRDPSGSRESCVSPYGVHDMTGNVDEWVVNQSGHPYRSGLKGGYWGPVRDRCRPMTVAHDENFAFYQIGFRCCGDPGVHTGGNGKAAAAVTSLAGT